MHAGDRLTEKCEDKQGAIKAKLVELGFLNKVLNGDAIEVLKKFPDHCVDLVFADPPYNLQLVKGKKLIRWNRTVVDGVKEDWDKFLSFEDYDRFTNAWLKEVRRVKLMPSW